MEAVRVIARIRPPSQRDIEMNNNIVIRSNSQRREITVDPIDRELNAKTFSYDGVYGPDDHTTEIFEENIIPIAKGALEGYNGTVFAYGQTGSGKSFTMYGGDQVQTEGIVFCAIDYVYKLISQLPEGYRTLVYCSFLEIYKEDIRDLLWSSSQGKIQTRPQSGLKIRQDSNMTTYADGLNILTAQDAKECRRIAQRGLKLRQQAATKMNADSSRSHAIFTMTIEVSETTDGNDQIRVGKLNFVDLAGSERQSKTENEKDRQEESIKINLSLTTLGRIIQILSDGILTHIPYRDSKLTRLLENSLGGNAKTVMICCVSPTDDNREESLNTLTYASRAKQIKNKPIVNTDPKNALLREYLEKIRRLEEQIASTPNIEEELQKEGNRVREELRREHLKEIRRLEEKREQTFIQFEAQMKEANEEEKRRLTKEKDEEISRIHAELAHRHKEEFKRLEMQKAQEYQLMEEQLKKALESEKERIQKNLDLDIKVFKEDAQKKHKTRLAEFEKDLSKRLTSDHEERIAEDRKRLDAEYSERHEEEKRRLEEQAGKDTAIMKVQFLREQENERRNLQKSKADELLRIVMEKDVEINRMRDELQQEKEEELQRIKQKHERTMAGIRESARLSGREDEEERKFKELEKRLTSKNDTEIQLLQEEHRLEIDRLLNEVKDAKRRGDSPNLLQKENNKLQRRLQNLEIKFQNSLEAKDEQIKELIARCESQMQNQNQKAAKELRQVKKKFAITMQNTEEGSQKRLQENEKTIREQYVDTECDSENVLEQLKPGHHTHILTMHQTWKELTTKLSHMEAEVDQLRSQNTTLKVERDQALCVIDNYEQNHIGCHEMQEDQQQKIKELEGEIRRLQKQLTMIERSQNQSNVASTSSVRKPLRINSGSSKYRTMNDRIAFDNQVCVVPPIIIPHSAARLQSSPRQLLSRASSSRTLPDKCSSSRREALIEAVAGVNAENFLSCAKEEYEKQLDQYVHMIEERDFKIKMLTKQLTEKSPTIESSGLDDGHLQLTKQEQITLLYQQILSCMIPHLPNCNYKDISRIAKSAVWNSVAQKWRLEPLISNPLKTNTDYIDPVADTSLEGEDWRKSCPERNSSLQDYEFTADERRSSRFSSGQRPKGSASSRSNLHSAFSSQRT